jgi:hypothetical protein
VTQETSLKKWFMKFMVYMSKFDFSRLFFMTIGGSDLSQLGRYHRETGMSCRIPRAIATKDQGLLWISGTIHASS